MARREKADEEGKDRTPRGVLPPKRLNDGLGNFPMPRVNEDVRFDLAQPVASLTEHPKQQSTFPALPFFAPPNTVPKSTDSEPATNSEADGDA